MNKAAQAIIDFAFPPCCPCRGDLVGDGQLICGSCEEKLEPAKLAAAAPESCEYAASAFVYDGAAKNGVLALKEGEGRSFAVYAADLLAERLGGNSATLVTSVPMHPFKRALRGRDQAEVFGRLLAERLGLPYEKGLLRCRFSRKHQHNLNISERRIHAESIFEKAKAARDLSGERVMICDDILTTGSTVSACAGLLLELGAKEVGAVTICKTSGDRS